MRSEVAQRMALGLGMLGLVSGVLGATRAVRLDVSGVYDLQFDARGEEPSARTPSEAAATLTQTDDAVTGVVLLDMLDPSLAGPYVVTGRVVGHRVRLNGQSADGAQFAWRGVAWQGVTVNDGMAGPVRLRYGHERLSGRLTFSNESGPSHGGSSTTTIVTTTTLRSTTTRVATTTTRRATTTTTSTVPPTTLPPTTLAPTSSTTTTSTPATTTSTTIDTASTTTSTTTASTSTTTTAPPNPYLTHCASCHGIDGGGGIGPNIRCSVPSRITNAVRNGRGNGVTMPAFATNVLTNTELGTIGTTLDAWCNDSGSELYAGNCGTCHGATADGGRNANGIRGPDIHCANAGDLADAIRQGPDEMPAFPDMTAGQIGNLSAWIRALCGGPTTTVVTTTTTTPPSTTTAPSSTTTSSTTTLVTTTTTTGPGATTTTVPGTTTTTTTTSTTTTTVPAPRFAQDVQPILTASCAVAFCHGSTGPAMGLDLSASHAHALLVNVASSEVPALKRVLPGNIASSYLYQKMANLPGIVGGPMPAVAVPGAQLETVAAWIAAGAPNN